MVDKVTKNLTLDLSNVNRSLRSEAKKEIGDFVKDEILRSLSEGQSPVAGERFKRLDKNYANKEKNGNRTPNLELTGDMLDALKSKNTEDGIEIGIFGKKQSAKADGHNNFSGESKLPKRRFIPDEDQNFRRSIQSGIDNIIEEYENRSEQAQAQKDSSFPSFDSKPSAITTPVRSGEGIDVTELFGGDFISSIINEFFNGQS